LFSGWHLVMLYFPETSWLTHLPNLEELSPKVMLPCSGHSKNQTHSMHHMTRTSHAIFAAKVPYLFQGSFGAFQLLHSL